MSEWLKPDKIKEDDGRNGLHFQYLHHFLCSKITVLFLLSDAWLLWCSMHLKSTKKIKKKITEKSHLLEISTNDVLVTITSRHRSESRLCVLCYSPFTGCRGLGPFCRVYIVNCLDSFYSSSFLNWALCSVLFVLFTVLGLLYKQTHQLHIGYNVGEEKLHHL